MTMSLEVLMTFGGIFAGTSLEISPDVARHHNEAAARAKNVLPGEFIPFEPGPAFSIACPMAAAYPRNEFIEAYQQLRVRLDDRLDLRLADYPRVFSSDAREVERVRAVPTYIPKSELAAEFFGAPHQVELYQNGTHLFGPVERFFHTATSGAVFNRLDDGEGKLVVEVSGNLDSLATTGHVVFHTDPVFGEPLGAAQVHEDGSTTALAHHLSGKNHVGDVTLWNDVLVSGVVPGAAKVVLELYLPNRGTGLAVALYNGHTSGRAFRADASVL